MFGLFRKSVHEPVEKQREDAAKLALGPVILGGADCDEVPGGQGPLSSLGNPIPVNGPIGEIKYLGKLRGKTGNALLFHRLGSVSSPAVETPVDVYEVVCLDGTQWNRLYFDSYHPRRSNLAPPGYTLVPYNKDLGMDMPFAFGVNELVPDFPFGLVEAVVQLYGDSPGQAFARKIEERLKQHDFRHPNDRSSVVAHILDPKSGYSKETWTIGERIKEATVQRLGQNGNVFVVVQYEAGMAKQVICKNEVWEQVRAQFEDIDRSGRESMRHIMDELNSVIQQPNNWFQATLALARHRT